MLIHASFAPPLIRNRYRKHNIYKKDIKMVVVNGAVGTSHLNTNSGISNSFNMFLRGRLRMLYPHRTINEITQMMNSIPAGTFDKGIRLIRSKTGSMLPGNTGYMKIISSEAEKFARAIEQNNGTFPKTGPFIDGLEAGVKRLGGKAAKTESLVGKVAAKARLLAEAAKRSATGGFLGATAKDLAQVGNIFRGVGRAAGVGGITLGFLGSYGTVYDSVYVAKFLLKSLPEKYNDLTQNRDWWESRINNYDEVLNEVIKHLDLV